MAGTREQPHFGRETFRFLKELAANNEREWFGENKHRYESHVLEPALEFIASMGPPLEKISTHFVAIPKRVGGSLMRIYRDTRFSRDKTPYKTNVGIQFRHELGKDVHAPGFYVHIEPGECFLGAGIWHPDAGTLAKIRESIAEDGGAWRKAAYGKRLTDHLSLAGSALVRPPKGYGADTPYIEDLKRKDFIAICPLPDSAVSSTDFPKLVADRFSRSRPLMSFLCDAIGLAF